MALTVIGLSLAAAPQAKAVVLFQGEYAPANWTFSNNNADGSVYTSNAPSSINLTGGDDESGSPGNTDYTITAAGSGTVSFNWNYTTLDIDGPVLDPFGYLLNGNFTQLTNDSGLGNQSGTANFNVLFGQTFGFSQTTTDNFGGRANTIISNFDVSVATPVPWETDSLPIIGSTALFGLGVWTKRRGSQRKYAQQLK